MVVFDLEHQGTRYHLAVARRVIERSGTCAGCHGAERRRGDSPHRFIDRPRP